MERPIAGEASTSQTISANVRRLRLAHGWTQEEAARRLGEITGTTWSNASWSAAEKQTRAYSWSAEQVAALARLFRVGFEELLNLPGEPSVCPTCGQEMPK